MSKPDRPTAPATVPGKPSRVLAGLASAAAAIGAGHLVAAFLNPAASPLLAVGSVAIDLAPTPAKEFVVRTFGNYDKPLLVGSIGLALVVFAAVIGLIAWRFRLVALIGIGALGLVGAGATIYRLGPTECVPSLVAGVVGVAALAFLTRHRRGAAVGSTGAGQPARTIAGRRRGRGRRCGVRSGRARCSRVPAVRPAGCSSCRTRPPPPSRSRPAHNCRA